VWKRSIQIAHHYFGGFTFAVAENLPYQTVVSILDNVLPVRCCSVHVRSTLLHFLRTFATVTIGVWRRVQPSAAIDCRRRANATERRDWCTRLYGQHSSRFVQFAVRTRRSLTIISYPSCYVLAYCPLSGRNVRFRFDFRHHFPAQIVGRSIESVEIDRYQFFSPRYNCLYEQFSSTNGNRQQITIRIQLWKYEEINC